MNKFSKGTIKSNIIESIETLGKDTTKKSFEAIKNTFNPIELLNKAVGVENKSIDMNEDLKNKNNHTKLDFQNLQKKYEDKDKTKLDAYRQKLFQLVKSGEAKTVEEKKQSEEQQKQQENNKEQEEAKKNNQLKAHQQQVVPMGKQKRGVAGGKRKANVQLEQSIEYKQNAGK